MLSQLASSPEVIRITVLVGIMTTKVFSPVPYSADEPQPAKCTGLDKPQ